MSLSSIFSHFRPVWWIERWVYTGRRLLFIVVRYIVSRCWQVISCWLTGYPAPAVTSSPLYIHVAYMQEPLFVCLFCALHVVTSRQAGILATDLRSSAERAPMLLKMLCTTAMQNHTMTTAGTEAHKQTRHAQKYLLS